MTWRVIHLNHADITSGAGRAAYRIHHAVRAAGADSHMQVIASSSGDSTVRGATTSLERVINQLRGRIGDAVTRTLRTTNPVRHSPALLSSVWPRRLNASDAELIHLHWINGEMLSIRDISRIQKPMVWTLHDMWPFCGAEHYTEEHRWREGYHRKNRPADEFGLDLNRWTWERKRRYWRRPCQIVTPSRWLANCVRQSALMRDWPVSVIPNAIDTQRWRPVDQSLARNLLRLPSDVPLLLFGAMDGAKDPRKGFDLLLEALAHLRGDTAALELVIFGQLAPHDPPDLGFPIHYMGHLYDDISLQLLYSAADVLAIPSRQDNLPNTGVEAMACGTPVVAFDTGGLPDIVRHQQTGYLAEAFDPMDFAHGLRWVLARRETPELAEAARRHAVDSFSREVVASHYLRIYDQATNVRVLNPART